MFLTISITPHTSQEGGLYRYKDGRIFLTNAQEMAHINTYVTTV